MAIFTNQASLSYNNTVTTSNITTGELIEALSVTKTALDASYGAGDRVTYVVSIINSAATPLTGLTLTDDLGQIPFPSAPNFIYPLDLIEGSILYYINGTLQPDPAVTAGPPLTVSGITIPASSNATLIYEAAVTPFAPLAEGSVIENTVTVNNASGTALATATETVQVTTEPLLSVTKALSPTSVTENGTLTYTFTIQNSSNTPADAGDSVTLTDLFDPALSDLSVTFNSVPWTSPANYTYSPDTGLFSTVPGQITVPAASFSQDPETGRWTTTPGVSVLTVTGTV